MATGELHQLSVVYWCESGCNHKFSALIVSFGLPVCDQCVTGVSTQFLIDKTKTDLISAMLMNWYGFTGKLISILLKCQFTASTSPAVVCGDMVSCWNLVLSLYFLGLH